MPSLKDLVDAIEGAGTRLHSMATANGWSLANPLIHVFGWNAPSLSFNLIQEETRRISQRVSSLTNAQLATDGLGAFLELLIPIFNSVSFSNVQNDPDAVIGGYMSLLTMVDNRIPLPPPPKPQVDWEEIKDSALLPRDLRVRLKRVETHLTNFEPQVIAIGSKIADIEAAHDAAEQLPTDLAELAKRRGEVKDAAEIVAKQAAAVEVADEAARDAVTRLTAKEKEASALVEKAEEAYRITTSKGLAGAFQERAESLSFTGWVWVGSLIGALLLALYIGADRVATLKDVLTGDKSASVVWVNALLAIAGVGAPIWLAWLSTRQIGQSFRLAEDYAYKASVAKAYEGYRREAVSLDPALANRLFSSALTRLEEAPIRLIEREQHNTPVQDFLSSPQVSALLSAVPELKDKLVALVPGKGQVVALAMAPIAAMAAATANKPGDKSEEQN